MTLFPTENEAAQAALLLQTLRVSAKRTRVISEAPPPPYSTLTLLEDAACKLGWSSQRTMQTAQMLFEQGQITYPRTDSEFLSPDARERAADIIRSRFGAQALARVSYKSRRSTDNPGAHEAIRPTDPTCTPNEQAGLLPDAAALYQMIWQRMIASQMKPARIRIIEVDLESV